MWLLTEERMWLQITDKGLCVVTRWGVQLKNRRCKQFIFYKMSSTENACGRAYGSEGPGCQAQSPAVPTG